MQSSVCSDIGNDARASLSHRNCTGQVLQFHIDEVQRTPCSCTCHRPLEPKVAVVIADDAEPKELICSRCKALLEDGPADSEQELDFEQNFSMDRTFAREIDGLVLCQTCHWRVYG